MGARCSIEAGKNTGSQQTRTSTWRAAFFTATPPVQRRQFSRGEPWHHSNKPTRRIMWARAARVRAYRAHRLAARGLLKDRADRPLSLPQTAGELIAGREEKRQPVVEPQSALPALLALCISSVLPRRPHRRRRECHWGAGENIGTEEVFRVRVRVRTYLCHRVLAFASLRAHLSPLCPCAGCALWPFLRAPF